MHVVWICVRVFVWLEYVCLCMCECYVTTTQYFKNFIVVIMLLLYCHILKMKFNYFSMMLKLIISYHIF